uniref:Coenzyme Q-binding protein COQ10 START domain-containing protein n=1 Tax=Glycine max TaxID=3847 RepID=A0A0R0K3H7_SOYBN
MDADASLPPLPAITFSLPSLALAFPLSPEDCAIVILIIMLFKQDNFLDAEMVKKVFYPEITRRGAFWEQLFDVVSAVDFYHGFVPWCQRSEILRHYPDGSFDAELEIGFKFLVESYVSHVELDRPKRIKTTVSQSTLFEHLINIWEFNPGPVPGSCDLYFLVDFKFQSPLYRQIASMFFKEVASRMVGSFTERCRLVYGPEVRVLENSYGKRA